ncbi:MBL fold metallo-hydrolase [Candidatus Woesearchaeota archaeon]|nr:MBL fold metallo-hydrolase [Candidatus Woesearchaeota archaeon]
MNVEEFLQRVEWLGHASFFIKGEPSIMLDPFKISRQVKADIVLITHEHFDHCSVEDLEKVVTTETIIVCPPDCQSKLARVNVKEVLPISPGKTVSVKGVTIRAVPAYNTNKPFHPKENEWVGYVLTIDGVTIYHAGDTDLIPEMKELQNIDIAMLPVSGTYVMNAQEAAEAVKIIKPKIAIPMHYGSIVGSLQDAEKFKQELESAGFKVVIKHVAE